MLKRPKVLLPIALVLAGSMWFYLQYVLIGHQKADAAAHGIPRGNLSDLYPRWWGARELLLHHRDPYSSDVTHEIQIGYYGRALDPTRPDDPKDQQGFAYPIYVVFLLAPTVNLPFPAVQRGFYWLLISVIVASVLLWLRVLNWRMSLSTAALAIILSLSCLPVLQGLKLQQLSLLVAGLVAVCIALLETGWLLLAGIILAVTTVKPQLVLLLAAWLLLWAVSQWSQRQNLVWGFATSMAILLGLSEYLWPGWLGQFREALSAYRAYNEGAESVLEVILTPVWGRAFTAIVLLALGVLCWKLRRAPEQTSAFKWLLVLTLAVTVVVMPKTALYNQVLLLPGVLFALRQEKILRRENHLTRLIAMITGWLICWPWLAAACLTITSVFMPLESVQKAWALPLYTTLTIPIAMVVLLAFGFREVSTTSNNLVQQ